MNESNLFYQLSTIETGEICPDCGERLRIGNKKAAAQLGIPYYTLADWRNKSKHNPKNAVALSEEESA